MKTFKIIALSIFILMIILIIIGLRMSFRTADTQLVKKFEKDGIELNVNYYKEGENTIRLAETGDAEEETVYFFIHGAPGSLEMFNNYLKDPDLRSEGLVVSIDRPGYGFSNPGSSETSIIRQADLINNLIKKKYADKDIVLIGHSFGAPIAAYIAYLNPEQVKKAVLAAGAVDPENEKLVTFARISNLWLVRKISGNDTKVATDEKLTHVEALKEIEHIWPEIRTQLVAQHGTKDRLVPFGNVSFLRDRVPSEYLQIDTLEGKGHIYVFNEEALKRVLR